MEKQQTVDWIEHEFFGGYWGGHYTLHFHPDGLVKYEGEGELSIPLRGSNEWSASPRVFKNLARILLERRWENEIDQSGENFEVCDGWSEMLCWSIQGEIHEYTVKNGVGPESILKIIDRLGILLKEEAKKHPSLAIDLV